MPDADASSPMNQFTPRSLLLTGGAGFIGSAVLLHLVRRLPSCRFVCLDKLSHCSSTKHFESIQDLPNFKFVKGSVSSLDLVAYILESEKIDTVMHFAAQSHVDNSFGNSIAFTMDNVLGTHVLLEACRLFKHQIRRIIHVSTDEVYGEAPLGIHVPAMNEQDPLEPTNPYAATKTAAEYIVKAYRRSFGLPTIISRGNNVYGPRQYPEKLIPKFISLLEKQEKCPIYGDGSNLRCFLFVEDVARAFECILTKGRVGEIYNIGTSQELSTMEVLHRLLVRYGLDSEKEKHFTFVPDRPFNDMRYWIDTRKLSELGWKMEVGFDEGLKRTIEWYRAHPNYFDSNS